MDTSRPRYLHMFLVFVKIGLFTIGGGPVSYTHLTLPTT